MLPIIARVAVKQSDLRARPEVGCGGFFKAAVRFICPAAVAAALLLAVFTALLFAALRIKKHITRRRLSK